jgi:hypothetical protein
MTVTAEKYCVTAGRLKNETQQQQKMLWRRAMSESGYLSPEEQMLQRRLALKRGESLQEW